MHNYSDEQLCVAAQSGDESARAEIVNRYMSLVGIRASAYIYRTDGFEHDDLGQEGFIGLLCAVNDYRKDMGASFKTFALLCIDRKISDAVKKAMRKKQVPDNAKVELEKAINIGTPSAESEVIAKDEMQRVRQRLDRYASEYEKRVFSLYLSGRSYKQIANILDSSPKSVENALARVRRKIAFD